jgi:Fe-S-cluster-containing dehydrogenase component
MCCPADALTIGPLGQIIISPNACILCGACEKACPIGAIELFNDCVYVCDLCGGEPKCVDACTEGAIINNEKKTSGPTLAEVEKQTKKMNPIQKRHFYLRKLGAKLREKWRKKYA